MTVQRLRGHLVRTRLRMLEAGVEGISLAGNFNFAMEKGHTLKRRIQKADHFWFNFVQNVEPKWNPLYQWIPTEN